ncbi:hypothetical protein [Lacrimispora xylanisolvens]|uniref:hypothetical protein n=1 Tax=Lacrimispora xylanisolvens TaxID=384636 RepID=UPI002402CD21
MFDAFSLNEFNAFQEKQIWEVQERNGFWREDGYVELKRCCKYPQHVTLEQYIIISKAEASSYYLWNTFYDKETLLKEVKECGFNTYGIYGDVSGATWNIKSPTIAVILEK